MTHPHKTMPYAAYYRKNRERLQAQKKAYYQANREKILAQNASRYSADDRFFMNIKALYGMTREQYKDMEHQQGGRCRICDQVPSGRSARLCVDHDHGTHKIRGLLCNNCNVAIGLLLDSPQLLRTAATYLETV